MKLWLLCLFVGVIKVSGQDAPSDRSIPGISQVPGGTAPDLSCEGDGRYRRDCNWCRCANGKSLCTKKACPTNYSELPATDPECEGNVSFRRDCNTCSCHEGKAICTTKYCGPLDAPPEISVDVAEERTELTTAKPEPECTPGSRWRVDCNWCTCADSGVGLCTTKGCFGEESDEPECSGTSEWKRDCNWCNCVEGRAVCTEKACLAPDTGSVTQCEEGSSWTEDCNICRCKDGLKLCTRRLCPDTVPNHCLLPPVAPDAPLCEAIIYQWTFSSELSKCVSIVYGGCGGTENLFDSEADCQASCVSPSSQTILPRGAGQSEERSAGALTKDQKDCLLPMDPGPCFAAQPRYFYNKTIGKCESFNYGGCQGNKNRYATLQECQETCAGIAPPTGTF